MERQKPIKVEEEDYENDLSYDVEDEPIILSKPLLDLLLQQDRSSDLIALYAFYYYTAKWQKTNQPKATTEYVAQGLQWGTSKTIAIKKKLKQLGLIEDTMIQEGSGKITGHYTKINFIWTRHHTLSFTRHGISPPMVKQEINALSSNNINALSSDNICPVDNDLLEFSDLVPVKKETLFGTETTIAPSMFDIFWKLYPKKDSKGKALTSWNTLCRGRKGIKKPSWEQIIKAVTDQKTSERWQNGIIPMAATWLNQSRWLDDPKELKMIKSNNSPISGTRSYGAKVKYREPDQIITH
jgi:hypothetical protein